MISLVNSKFGCVEIHRAVVANCRDVLCVQKEAKIVWVLITRRDLVRDPERR